MTTETAGSGDSILLIAAADPFRPILVDALHEIGDRVTVLDPIGECHCGHESTGPTVDPRAILDAAAPKAIVHVVRASGSPGAVPFDQIDIPGWTRLVHDPLWSLIETVRFAESGSAPLIVVVESTGLSGAAGATMGSATAEGARAIAKSAARVFGCDGPQVQTIAVDPIVFSSTDVIGNTIRPRNRTAPTLDDLAELIGAARRLPDGVGGALLVLDGGRTMLP